MAQPYSTPGNSANDFYTPQASGTRRAQANPASSYFGTGGQTGYSQSAWSGGNNGNPSGIGSGAAGVNAGDGPGAGSAGLNYGNGPNGFSSSLDGTANVPGSTGNFQWGSVVAGPFGTGYTDYNNNYSDPATAQQYSDSMMATGDPYGGQYGGQPTGTGPNSIMPGGQQSGGATQVRAGGPRQNYLSAPDGAIPGGMGGIPGAPDQWMTLPEFNQYRSEYLAGIEQDNLARQQQAHQDFLDANPGWVSPEQLAANMQANSGMRAAEDALLAQYPGGIPNDIHQQMLSQFGMQAGGNTGQSQLGAAMQSGMPTQAIGQQMGAPGAVDPYSTALPESFAQGGYQPGDTSIPTGNIGGAPPNAVSPERFGRLPVNELQRIASGQGGQLRPELQQQAAMMASNELARRGAGGNNLAAGNQQAQDPRAVEQSTGFQQAERIRQLQQMGIDTGGFGPEDALRGNTPQEQQRLEAMRAPQGFQGGAVQFLQGLGQGLGWMNPTNIPGFGSSPSTPPPEVAMDPEALFRDSLAQVRQQYGPIDIFGGWNTTGAPDVPGVGTGQMPGSIGGDVPMRPLAPQGPGGVPQNPYEKMPGYVQPYSQPQSPMSTGNPIWGSQPESSSNPYPGTIQTIPFGQGLPPGISGSMAIGPDGKPYGGTPNLSRPEPNPGTIPGNDFPGYGNDVVERPKSPSQLARERAEEAMRGSQRTAQANQDPNSIFYNHGPNSKLLAAVLGNPNYN